MSALIAKMTKRFQQIDRERMQGLPFYNSNIQVESLGFEEREDGYIGVLITPWFINLMLLFKEQPQDNVVVGRKVTHTLPSGEYDFMVGEDEELGRYDFISLSSPVGIYKSQQQAQGFAMQKLHNYMTTSDHGEDEHPLVFIERKEKSVTRRGFLSGNARSED